MPPSASHVALVQLGAKWMHRQGCTVVLADPQTWRASEWPDVIGWRHGCHSLLLEVKVSRVDFLRDRKKPQRHERAIAMGGLRWYLAPAGLIRVDELPQGWGLLEQRGKRIVEVKKPIAHDLDVMATRSELGLLINQFERLQQQRELNLVVRSFRPLRPKLTPEQRKERNKQEREIRKRVRDNQRLAKAQAEALMQMESEAKTNPTAPPLSLVAILDSLPREPRS